LLALSIPNCIAEFSSILLSEQDTKKAKIMNEKKEQRQKIIIIELI